MRLVADDEFAGDPNLSDPRLCQHQLQLAPAGDSEAVGRVKVQSPFIFGQRRLPSSRRFLPRLPASTMTRSSSCAPARLLIII